MSAQREYWIECIQSALDEHGVEANAEQIAAIAGDVEVAHECYGMAFYSPPASDRYSQIEREWRDKLAQKQRELDTYRENAEAAVKRALRQYDDAMVSIGENGEVFRHGGRTEQIQ